MNAKIIPLAIIMQFSFSFSLIAENEDNKQSQLPTYTFFDNVNYTITGEKLDYFKVKFTMRNSSNNSDPVVFNLDFLTSESFYLQFKKGLLSLTISKDSAKIRDEANRLYYQFVAGLQTLALNDEGPIAGQLTLTTKKNIEITKVDNQLKPHVEDYLKDLKKDKGRVKKQGVRSINGSSSKNTTIFEKEVILQQTISNNSNISETSKNSQPVKIYLSTNAISDTLHQSTDNVSTTLFLTTLPKSDTFSLSDKAILDTISLKTKEIKNDSTAAYYVGRVLFGRNPNTLVRQFPYRRRFYKLPHEEDANWLTKKEATRIHLDYDIRTSDNKTKSEAFKTEKEYLYKKNIFDNFKIQKNNLDSIIKDENFHIDSLNNIINTKKLSFNKIIVDSVSLFLGYSSIAKKIHGHFNNLQGLMFDNQDVNDITYGHVFKTKITEGLGNFYSDEIKKLEKIKSDIDTVSLLKSLDDLESKLKIWEDSIPKSTAEEKANNLLKKDSVDFQTKTKKTELENLRKLNKTNGREISELNWLNQNMASIATLISQSYILKNEINKLQIRKLEINKELLKKKDSINVINQNIVSIEKILDSLFIAYNRNLKNLVKPSFKIDKAEIEFNNGLIENIRIKGRINPDNRLTNSHPDKDKLQTTLYFENLYPIGFSRESDYDYLYKTFLYANSPIKSIHSRNESVNYTLRLSDAIEYDYKHELNRRDYSPKNDVITIDTTSNNNPKILHKLETSNLFEIKVFSDFVGFNETSPNGLIQTELEKEIPILTRRYPGIYSWRSNWGFLSYVIPNLVISKIEDQNKYLPISYYSSAEGSSYLPIKYASTLDLYKYESFNTGIDLNLYSYDIINAKSTFNIDGGFKYGITPIVDSTRNYSNGELIKTAVNTENINTFRVYPKASIVIHPEERYSLKLSFIHNWYWARTNSFIQVGNSENFQNKLEKQKRSNHFNTAELSANFNVNEKNSGKLFFRYRFNWQQGYWNTGFSQIQFGYSFFLVRKL